MKRDEWVPEAEPSTKVPVVTIDRRPLAERAKLVDRGLVDFRRVCDQVGSRPFPQPRYGQTRPCRRRPAE
jgi:hypothetical protein